MAGVFRNRFFGAAIAVGLLFTGGLLHAQSTPLQDGLISYWPLNEGAGAVANDAATGGTVADNGTVRNSPTWIAGQFGAGLQFTGTQDVLIPASADMDINSSAVTISAWVKLDKLPSEILGSFAGVLDAQADNYVLYLDKGANELRFKATTASGASTSAHPGIPASMLDTTSWHHVMGVYDGSTGSSRIYLNGNLADIATIATSANMAVRTGQISSIGGQPAPTDPFAPSNFYEGGIADVAVWNRPLGEAEAEYLYNSGTGNAVGAANPAIAAAAGVAPIAPSAQPVIYYNFNGNLNNHGTGGAALNGVFRDAPGGTGPVYAPTEAGQGLDLSSNPRITNSTDGGGIENGKFVSVDYTLPEQGTIALRFSSSDSFNFQTLWANSSNANAWESWIYEDTRVSARGNSGANAANLDQRMSLLGGIADTHHYAFTWQRNGTSMEAALYVDGVLREVSTETWQAPGTTFFLGGGVGNHLSKGLFDEFRIYDTRLSEAEILHLARVPEPGSVVLLGLSALLGGGWAMRRKK